MKNILLALGLLFVCVVSFASGGEAHGAHDEGVIPYEQIGWQAANLGVLLVAIFFAAKKGVIETFANRKKEYLEQSEKTKSALVSAEQALAGIKDKLAGLEAGEKKSFETAQNEANILKANLIKDAEAAAEKMKRDAELVIRAEVSKAKSEINGAILTQAVDSAKKALETKSQKSSVDQESAFVNQLGQVKP